MTPALVFIAVGTRRAELGSIARVMSQAAPVWLIAAGLLQVTFLVVQAAFYRGLFRLTETAISLRTGLVLALAMAFTSLASPAGTAAGLAAIVEEARTRSISGRKAIVASLMYYVFDYVALLIVLAAAFPTLLAGRAARITSSPVLMIIVAATLAIAAFAVWAFVRSGMASRSAGVLGRTITGMLMKRLPALRRWPDALAGAAEVLRQVGMMVRREPGRIATPVASAITLQGLNLLTLAAVFLALGLPVTPGLILAGAGVGAFFTVVSVTPSGSGVVEGAMTVVLASRGIALEAAIAATLLYRLFTFWLPMLGGLVGWRVLGFQGAEAR